MGKNKLKGKSTPGSKTVKPVVDNTRKEKEEVPDYIVDQEVSETIEADAVEAESGAEAVRAGEAEVSGEPEVSQNVDGHEADKRANAGEQPGEKEEKSEGKKDKKKNPKPKKDSVPFGVKLAGLFAPKSYTVISRSKIEKDLEEKDEIISGLEEEVRALHAKLTSEANKAKESQDKLMGELGTLSLKNEKQSERISGLEQSNKFLLDFKESIADIKASSSFPANPDKLEDWVLQLNEAYEALQDQVEKASGKPKEKSLQDILRNPSEDEKKQMEAYFRQKVEGALDDESKKSFGVGSLVEGIKGIISDLRKKWNDEKANNEALKQRNNAAYDKIKEANEEIVKRGSDEYFLAQLEDEARKPLINGWLMKAINHRLDRKEDKLTGERTLEENIDVIIAVANAPRSESEAVELARAQTVKAEEEGKKALEAAVVKSRSELLEAFGKAVSSSVESVEELPGKVEDYVGDQLQKRILSKIKLDLPLDELIPRLNSDIQLAGSVRKAFGKESDASDVKIENMEQYRKQVIAATILDLKKKLVDKINEKADDELKEKVLKEKLMEITSNLLALAVERGHKVEKLNDELQKIAEDNEKFAEANKIEFSGKSIAERLESVRKEEADRLAASNKQLELAEQTVARQKEEVATQSKLLSATFNEYLTTVRRALDDIGPLVREACDSPDRSGMIAEALDRRILKNPAGGYEDFREELNKKLADLAPGDTAGVRNAVRDLVLDFQQSNRATWIDVLVRLYLYSRVPFISAQFLDKQTDPTELARGVQALVELMGVGGLELFWPRLFHDKDTDGDFTFEAIRNIDSYVDDVSGHVSSSNLVVDLACVGIKDGGTVVKKPIVSLFNS